MLEILGQPFFQRAILAGLLIGVLGSYFGVFVVQRGLSFLGSGLAHATFGGVALGLLLNAEPLAVAVPFTGLIALGITWVSQRTEVGSETAVGIFFSVSTALGVVFISLKEGYSADAFTYLFGSILAVTPADLWISSAVLLLALLSYRLWGRWAYATFDRELAMTDRIPVNRDDYLLNIFIAVSVVVGVKLVGIILVTAFLVIPAATARLLAPTLSIMTVLSIAAGIASSLLGLTVSYQLDVPSGASIILVQATIFFLVIVSSRLRSAA